MSDVKEKSLPYRGVIKAIATDTATGATDNTVYFITEHQEKQLTPCYQLNLETLSLNEIPLKNRASALLVLKDQIWIGDVEGDIYCNGKRLAQLAINNEIKPDNKRVEHKESSITALVTLSQQRLGVLIGNQIEIIDQAKGTQLQTLELPEPGTAIAVDASGQWLVVGTSKGTVQVYENEDEDQAGFKLSESEKLHEGAITALAFDPTELRFLSAGNDNKLLLTHARGKLEPEDRGRGASHAAPITAIVQQALVQTVVQASAQNKPERFITGSQDKTCKSWLRSGASRPATFSESIGVVSGLAIATLHGRPQLVVANGERITIIALDASGKFGQLTHRLYDTYALAKSELASPKIDHRQTAIERLAGYGDKASLRLLDIHIHKDKDFGLRQLIAERIAATDHPNTQRLLESYLNHKDEAVRKAAFAQLQEKLSTTAPLRPMALALKTGQVDVGKLAVAALEASANHDDRAMMRLIDALDTKAFAVRIMALASLEA